MKAALVIVVLLWAILGWMRDQSQQHQRLREREAWQAYGEAQADSSATLPKIILQVEEVPASGSIFPTFKRLATDILALIPAVWFHSVLAGLTLLIAWRAFQA